MLFLKFFGKNTWTNFFIRSLIIEVFERQHKLTKTKPKNCLHDIEEILKTN